MKIQRYYLLIVAFLCAVSGSAEPFRLYIEDLCVKLGQDCEVSVLLDNDVQEFTGFQTQIHLPIGMTLVETYDAEEDANTAFYLNDERKRCSHDLQYAQQTDGSYKLLGGGNGLHAYRGNSGTELFHFTVRVATTFSAPATIRITNTLFTDYDTKGYSFADETCNVTVNKSSVFTPGYYIITNYRDPIGGAMYDNMDNVDHDQSSYATNGLNKLKWCISSNHNPQLGTFTYDATLKGQEWATQRGLAYMVWQAIPVENHENGYYLRNLATGRYIHTIDELEAAIELTESPSEQDIYTVSITEDAMQEDAGNIYCSFANPNLFHLSGVVAGLHASDWKGSVVAWDYTASESTWAIRNVTEDELEIISKALIIEKALDALDSNTETLFSIDGFTPASSEELNEWVNVAAVDGLVTQSTQITSNTSDPTEGANMGYLLDGNTYTFWHSNWHSTTTALHNLVVDLGKDVEEVSLKFASREFNFNGAPRVFAIYGSSDGSNWTAIGTSEVNWIETPYATSMSTTSYHSHVGWLTSPLGYRYMKLEVEHAGGIEGEYLDYTSSNNLYFNLSELRAYEGKPWKTIAINSIAAPALKTATEELIAQAQEELAKGNLTPETLAALNAATDNLKYAVENRVNTLRDDADYDGTEAKRVNIDYIRNFTSTDWDPLYIPFSMSYEEWADDFEIAAINNVRHDDTNGDGLLDRISIEARMVKSGKLQPNRPYIIRAKSIGTKTLHAAETLLTPAEQNSIDCSTVDTKFVFTGSYENIAASELTEYGCKVLSGGIVVPANLPLNPYRWYITTEEKGSGIKGDMNDDGRISIVDVNILVNVLAGKN